MRSALSRLLGAALPAALLVALVTAGPAAAQAAGNDKATLHQFASHTGPDCQGELAESGRPVGFVNAHRNFVTDTIIVNIHMKDGLPNARYDVFIKCLRGLGSFFTNSNGVGNATFKTPSTGIPPVFALDMFGHSPPANPLSDYVETTPLAPGFEP